MANSNAVDLVISAEAQRQVLELTNNLKKTDAEILSISANARALSQTLSGITLPSNLTQLNATNAQLTAQIQAQATALANLQAQYNSLSQNRTRNNQQSAEEALNQRLLNRNARELATTNSALAGAYGRLNAEQTRASRNLQDLVVRGRLAGQTQREYNRELQRAQNDFNRLNERVLSADRAVGRFNRNVGNYPMQAVKGLKDLIGAFGLVGGVSGAFALGKNIFETTKEIISLDNALKLVTETQTNFDIQQAFLIKTSEDFGVEIGGLTKQFTQFYVSAKDKLSGNEIQDIFRSITKAGSAMGLSTQNQERAFLALNQMMSKGTIQAEELRGQLGEALPGALGIMAKAVGVNEAELAKMMKAGQLLASDVLPKFAKQLEKTYGIENVNRIDNLSSAQTRLSNSWTNFVRSLDEDGNTLSKFFTRILGTLSEIVKGSTLIFQSETTKQQNTFKHLREKGYNDTLAYYNSLDELNKNDLKSSKDYMSQKILDNKKEVDSLRGRNLILKALDGRKFGMSSEEQSRVVANEAEKKSNNERIKDLANVTSSFLGQISAINSLLEPQKKALAISKEETKDKKEKVKVIKLEAVSQLSLSKEQDTALEKLKQLKKALEQTRDETSKNSTEFQQFEESIKSVNESIDFLTKGIAPIKLDIKNPISQLKELSDGIKNYLNTFSSEFISNSGFTETFSLLNNEIEGFGDNFAVTFNAIAESAQEAFNFISNISQKNFENENIRLQNQYDTAIKYAGGSAVAEAKLAEDLEKKKKEISIREAKAKQKQAIFNIAIDTAQAIMATVGKTGFAGLPLALTLGVIGAAQIAMVSSQQIPQYWMGGTHDGGLMMVNDGSGSNFRETIVTPDGNIHKPQGKNVIMNAPSGTEIFTHDQWNDQMNNMLKGNGINWSFNQAQSSGITKEDMKSAMLEAIGEQPQYHSNFDANGASNYIMKKGNITRLSSNRGNSIKQRFT